MLSAAHNTGTSKLHTFRNFLLSALLSFYCLPQTFRILPGEFTDSSWMRALAMAVQNKLVFGRDFIFTYGPLGFLSTRVCHHSLIPALLLGDVFLLVGYCYFFYTYVVGRKWLLIVLPAMFLLRSDFYNQNLFLIYIMLTCAGFAGNFRRPFELVYSAMAGVLLFYIKMNYGVITGGLTILVVLYLLFSQRKAAILYLAVALLLFFTFYFSLHIHLYEYIKYGLIITRHFDESMYLSIPLNGLIFLSSIAFLIITATLLIFKMIKLYQQKNITYNNITIIILLSMSTFLLYKNGHTRADFYHYADFFSGYPFFFIGLIFLLHLEKSIALRITALLMLALSTYIIALPDLEKNEWHSDYYLSFLTPYYYIHTLQDTRDEDIRPHLQLTPHQLQAIGTGTTDIYPTQIALLQYNHLRYHPRPIPQSYSVYSPVLDSINAAHVYRQGRPQTLLMQNEVFDNRYAFADESLSKAVIHLNYQYAGYISTTNADSLENRNTSFLLLHSISNKYVYPVFRQLETKNIKLGERVPVIFPDSSMIYMKANIAYSLTGRLRRIFYQPPAVKITIYFEDGVHYQYRAILPILKGGILINKAVLENIDLRNFMTGNISQLRKIVAFSIDTEDPGICQNADITFLEFSNY